MNELSYIESMLIDIRKSQNFRVFDFKQSARALKFSFSSSTLSEGITVGYTKNVPMAVGMA